MKYLNPLKIHSERITTANRRMINDLDYVDNKFPVSKTDYSNIEQKNSSCINLHCYKNDLIYPVHVSNKQFEK